MMHSLRILAISAPVLALALSGCGESKAGATPGVAHSAMADSLFAVLESDRAVYTRHVVNRLQNEEKVIKASETWKDDKALPLPAQMFRMGSEACKEKNTPFSYALLSIWAINKQNLPKTPAEKAGLEAVAKDPSKPYYGEETLGGKKYFTAVYPDKAVSPACIKCHNNHADSPRKDFKLEEVMGGVVIRIPTN